MKHSRIGLLFLLVFLASILVVSVDSSNAENQPISIDSTIYTPIDYESQDTSRGVLQVSGTTSEDLISAFVKGGSYTSPYCHTIPKGGAFSFNLYLEGCPLGEYEVIIFSSKDVFVSEKFKVYQYEGNDGWIYKVEGNNAVIQAYTGKNTELEVPSTIESDQRVLTVVLNEGTKTKSGVELSQTVTKLIIPSGMSVPDYAFKGNVAIKQLVMDGADSSIAIGVCSFADCTSLISAKLNSVNNFGDEAFANSTSLVRIELGNNLEIMGEGVFSQTALTEIELPDTFRGDIRAAFEGCFTLESVLIKAISSVGDWKYESCGGAVVKSTSAGKAELAYVPPMLKKLTIADNSISSIAEGAAKDTSIEYFEYSGESLSVGENSFEGCTLLEIVHIKCEKQIYLGQHCFKGASIEKIVLESDEVKLGRYLVDQDTGSFIIILKGEKQCLSTSIQSFGENCTDSITLKGVKKMELIDTSGASSYYLVDRINLFGDVDSLNYPIPPKQNPKFYVENAEQKLPSGAKASGLFEMDDKYNISYTSAYFDGKGVIFDSKIYDVRLKSVEVEKEFLKASLETNGCPDCDYDVYFNDKLVEADDDGFYRYEFSSNVTISVREHVGPCFVEVEFLDGDQTVSKLKHISERSIDSSKLPTVRKDGFRFLYWTLNGEEYSNQPIISNCTLKAEWVANKVKIAYFEGSIGSVSLNGAILQEGQEFNLNSDLEFVYLPVSGYEFISWNIKNSDGNDVESTSYHSDGYRLTIDRSAGCDIYISVNERNYSPSQSLINKLAHDTVRMEDDVSLRWYIKFENTHTDMGIWDMPSVPLIVGDFVYTYVYDTLFKIRISDGVVEKAVNIVPTTAYYHYLGYGEGVILQYSNGMAYDLELNPLWDMKQKLGFSTTAAFFHEGYFYGLHDGKLSKFDRDGNLSLDAAWSDGIEVTWWGTYGITSSPLFLDDKMYYLGSVNSSKPETTLYSIDIRTGNMESIRLGAIDGYYLDDGWLTTDGKSIFLTCYCGTGLFSSSGQKLPSQVVCIDKNLSNGDYYTVSLGDKDKGIPSAFVINDGRGYVNVNYQGMQISHLKVFDMSKFYDGAPISSGSSKNISPIYQETMSGSHGSLVIRDYGDKVLIYNISYQNSCVEVVEDHPGKTGSSGKKAFLKTKSSYGSQGVRIGPDGEMIWYSDSGVVFCATAEESSPYRFFIDIDGNAMWVEGVGSSAFEALRDAISKQGMKMSEAGGTIASIGGVSIAYRAYFDSQANFDKKEPWVEFANISDSVLDVQHVFVLSSNAKPGSTWYYENDDGTIERYEFKEWNSDAPLNVKLYKTETEAVTHIVSVSKDSSSHGIVMLSSRIVNVGSEVVVQILPDDGYSVSSLTYVFEGKQYAIPRTGNGFSFTMPNGDIAIEVSYQEIGEMAYSIFHELIKDEKNYRLNLTVKVADGAKVAVDPHILIKVQHTDGTFLNTCATLTFDDGVASYQFDTGVKDLSSILIEIVDGGMPSGIYSVLGEYLCSA